MALLLTMASAPFLAHAEDNVTPGTIGVPANAAVWTKYTGAIWTPDAAERAAACNFQTLGEVGQGITGWVIPVTGGSGFTLSSTSALPARFGVRFYAALPGCGDTQLQPIYSSATEVPSTATVAIVTMANLVSKDLCVYLNPFALVGCILTNVSPPSVGASTPLSTFIFTEHAA
jgi:hypothetical protein